ncbi:hypothetical protein [Paraherbaspirillum soli]|uniref:Uncharacterized protein n=1 Tax=Paraherbaspirillum soli TaxID=631222 RepID=A0ABW0MDS9_9BURK
MSRYLLLFLCFAIVATSAAESKLPMQVVAAKGAIAADKPFTGRFLGNGRACSGALYVRTKTIEWHSTYSACKQSRYQIIEQDMTGKEPRIAYLLKQRSKHCQHAVIELRHYNKQVWDANGYPSLEAYQKRDLPDWKDSLLSDREILSCGMLKAD